MVRKLAKFDSFRSQRYVPYVQCSTVQRYFPVESPKTLILSYLGDVINFGSYSPESWILVYC